MALGGDLWAGIEAVLGVVAPLCLPAASPGFGVPLAQSPSHPSGQPLLRTSELRYPGVAGSRDVSRTGLAARPPRSISRLRSHTQAFALYPALPRFTPPPANGQAPWALSHRHTHRLGYLLASQPDR